MATYSPAKPHGKKNKERRIARAPKAEPANQVQPDAPFARSVMKTTDNKGRLVLGGQFANRAVIMERLSETEIMIKLARVIPEREAWLYENPVALSAVRKGLAQARAGTVGQGPDVDADADLAARLED
jgi:hypothetical protein